MRGGGESGAVSETEYSKRLQSVVVSESVLAHPHQHPHGPHHGPHHTHHNHPHPPQGELRTLQKERLHLQHQLEQLEDGDSSGSETAFPRKRVCIFLECDNYPYIMKLSCGQLSTYSFKS